MTESATLRPTRRGALTGTLLVWATAGCDAITPDPLDPGGTSPPSPRSAPQTAADPDEELVAQVLADLADASVLVTSTLRSRPALSSELRPLARLHARHLAALEGDPPGGRAPVKGDAGTARSRVRDREVRLQSTLADASIAAQSGSLAALLASMSAAVGQRLAVPGGDA